MMRFAHDPRVRSVAADRREYLPWWRTRFDFRSDKRRTPSIRHGAMDDTEHACTYAPDLADRVRGEAWPAESDCRLQILEKRHYARR